MQVLLLVRPVKYEIGSFVELQENYFVYKMK